MQLLPDNLLLKNISGKIGSLVFIDLDGGEIICFELLRRSFERHNIQVYCIYILDEINDVLKHSFNAYNDAYKKILPPVIFQKAINDKYYTFSEDEKKNFFNAFCEINHINITSVIVVSELDTKNFTEELEKNLSLSFFDLLSWSTDILVSLPDKKVYINPNIEHLASLKRAFVALGYKAVTSSTASYISGGNIITGENFALLGGNQVPTATTSVLRANYAALFQVPEYNVLVIDNNLSLDGLNPLFHLDLFITYIGLDENNKPILLIADLPDRFTFGTQQDFTNARNIRQKLNDIVNTLSQVIDSNDNLPTFNIQRIPMAYGLGTLINYNNCILEIFENRIEAKSERNVYLPYYRSNNQLIDAKILALEKEAIATFESYAFQVSVIKLVNFYSIGAQRGGSLKCKLQVLERQR